MGEKIQPIFVISFIGAYALITLYLEIKYRFGKGINIIEQLIRFGGWLGIVVGAVVLLTILLQR